MKKFLAPTILFILVAALLAYLTLDFSGSKSSFDAKSYLVHRSQIDSLEHALWNAKNNPEQSVKIRSQLDSSWEALTLMRNAPEEIQEPTPFNNEIVQWVAIGAVAVIICIIILVLILKRRKIEATRQLNAIKSERFKPLEDETTIAPKPRAKKASIIAEAEAYAAQKHESSKVETPPIDSSETPKVEFEDENGVPENRILTEDIGSKPTLRPTAKERITSAMQNLSNVLHSPRGLSRERTMKLRAQSRNLTGNPNLAASPLEASRFDKEALEKNKILQMSRRGFPASAIASSLKISQEKVENVIKEAMG